MNAVSLQLSKGARTTGPPGPSPAGRLRGVLSWMSWPLVAAWRTGRRHWLVARGIRRPRRWTRPWSWLWPTLLGAVLVFYAVWIVQSIWFPHAVGGLLTMEGQLVNILGTSLTAVAVVAWFMFWRFGRVRRYYLRKAKHHPSKLVKPGSIIGRVVGRDPLCDALMTDLRDSDRRRPHVIVGTIGVGKTALLVRLTERLARIGAIPVVLQLRDVQEVEDVTDVRKKLNFSDLAMRRFLEEVSAKTRFPGEGEKVWQRLRHQQDKVVVLADGLEEALREMPERDNIIREAIAGADEEELPLVITSRPNDSLEAVQAALTALEPLSEEAALDHVSSGGNWRSDKQRLDWIVEAANVTGSPLYLEIARELETLGRLAPIISGGDDPSDARDQDEWALRYDLLEAWTEALVDGALYPEQPISHLGRRMTVEYLSALACAAPSKSSAEVDYEALGGLPDGGGHALDSASLRHVKGRLEEHTGKQAGKTRIDERTAGSWGSRLGLVDDRGDKVRFRHSVMQAYLASHYMSPLLENLRNGASHYFEEALERPGRELSTALVLYSRSSEAECSCLENRPCTIRHARQILLDAARRALEHCDQGPVTRSNGQEEKGEQDLRIKALEMYSAALDIDSFDERPIHRDIVKEIMDHWTTFQEYNERKLDSAKTGLAKRIGATARLVAEHTSKQPPEDVTAYNHLFALACKERSHAVRFAIAREIGEGGDTAFSALKEELVPSARRNPCPPNAPPPEDRTQHDDLRPRTTLPKSERLRRKDRDEYHREKRRQELECEATEREEEERRHRADIMRAWLSPMLMCSSRHTHHENTPYSVLSQWRRLVSEEQLDQGLGVALAQGFKQAANHRPTSSLAYDTRDFLSEAAEEMLRKSGFWFTRLTLLHALTLWALPDNIRQPQPFHGHGSNPRAQVRHWLAARDGNGGRIRMRDEHALVRAAATMCRHALETRRPDRFLWVDEADMASQVGSETSPLHEPRAHNLWIPPSTGWSTLDPAARQLLADVLVLTVLTEDRGDREEDLRRRMERVGREEPPFLPPCLTRSRDPLEPMRTPVGETPHSPPGLTCADGCEFHLCPYPPKAPESRLELNELFCIDQRELLNFVQLHAWLHMRFRRRAAWQRKVPVPDLRRFWDQMGGRARDRARDEVPGPRARSSR